MTIRPIALAAALGLMVACTHRPGWSLSPRDVIGETVEVELRDGKKVKAVAERTPNGVVWRTGRRSAVPWYDAREATVVSHGRGALDGLAFGAPIGVAAGILAGLNHEDCHTGDGWCMSQEAAMVMYGVVLGGAGALGGLLVGAIIGSRLVYEIDDPGDEEVRIGGPPGSVVGVSLDF